MSRLNEWNESLEETVLRSRRQSSLLAYSMVTGEVIEVGINGTTPEGIQIEESRTIIAKSLGLPSGALEVIADTSEESNWISRAICLGSYAFALGEIEFSRAGLLRGLIGQGQSVVVDLGANHFESDTHNQLIARYDSLSLEGHKIF